MSFFEVVLACVFINVMCWIGGIAVILAIIGAERRMASTHRDWLDELESRVMKGENDGSR